VFHLVLGSTKLGPAFAGPFLWQIEA
jgi:hypothetical protein